MREKEKARQPILKVFGHRFFLMQHHPLTTTTSHNMKLSMGYHFPTGLHFGHPPHSHPSKSPFREEGVCMKEGWDIKTYTPHPPKKTLMARDWLGDGIKSSLDFRHAFFEKTTHQKLCFAPCSDNCGGLGSQCWKIS